MLLFPDLENEGSELVVSPRARSWRWGLSLLLTLQLTPMGQQAPVGSSLEATCRMQGSQLGLPVVVCHQEPFIWGHLILEMPLRSFLLQEDP